MQATGQVGAAKTVFSQGKRRPCQAQIRFASPPDLPRLIFVDPKDSDAVKLREFWDKHTQERSCVQDEVCWVVLCVEACQEIPVGRERKNEYRKLGRKRRRRMWW